MSAASDFPTWAYDAMLAAFFGLVAVLAIGLGGMALVAALLGIRDLIRKRDKS